MAWLQTDPSGNFHISFRFGGQKFKRSLKTKSKRDAEARLHRLEENFRLVESGRLELPESGDIPAFLLSDGKLHAKTNVRKVLSLGGLFDDYHAALPVDNLENSTLKSIAIHRRHLERHFGVRFKICNICQTDIQQYICQRAKSKGIRGKPLSPTTIKKELSTLCTVWNWGVSANLLAGVFPNKGLKYPKSDEKPRFQTWNEINSRIQACQLTLTEQKDLWDCLFLSCEETEQFLSHVKANARHPFLYPMVMTAAHTGARRSELLRSKLIDIDGRFLTFHERKRVRGQRTTRRVPISTQLAAALNEWQAIHPGGPFTFCMAKTNGPTPISRDESHDHFHRTIAGSKWGFMRGWHCLRHSFCSNCAKQGIDERIIDSWVGHTTESMRKRYRHLFPDQESSALKCVFG